MEQAPGRQVGFGPARLGEVQVGAQGRWWQGEEVPIALLGPGCSPYFPLLSQGPDPCPILPPGTPSF